MRSHLLVILHVICTYLVQSESSLNWSCPRTCRADDQVITCSRLSQDDLVTLTLCVEELPDTVVVELTNTPLSCSCAFVDFLSELHSLNVVVFHDVNCFGDIVATCRRESQSTFRTTSSTGSYVPLFDVDIDVAMPNWQEVFESHFRRIWWILASLRNPRVCQTYLKKLVKMTRLSKMELYQSREMLMESTPSRLRQSDSEEPENISFWANSTKFDTDGGLEMEAMPSSARARMTRVAILSSFLLGVVIFVLIILLCKMEFERRNMDTRPNRGALRLDYRLQAHLNNWRSFLEKLARYKKRKAEKGGATIETHLLEPQQDVFVQQAPLESSGSVVPRDSRSAVAVSPLTKLVPVQPEMSRSWSSQEHKTSRREEPHRQRSFSEGESRLGAEEPQSQRSSEDNSTTRETTPGDDRAAGKVHAMTVQLDPVSSCSYE